MRIRSFLMVSTFISITTATVFAQETSPTPTSATPTTSAAPSVNPPAPPANKEKETDKEKGTETDKPFVITEFKKQCVKDLSTENIAAGDFGNYISFGPTVAAKAFNYDLASKQITFNAGLGAGLSMRIYNTVHFKSGKNAKGDLVSPISYGISDIRKKCRAETYDLAWLKPDNQMVAPLISISPMVFASKTERSDEIQVQPALTVGFLGELVNVGAGFNLSGPDKGHVFLILSLGYGFKF